MHSGLLRSTGESNLKCANRIPAKDNLASGKVRVKDDAPIQTYR